MYEMIRQQPKSLQDCLEANRTLAREAADRLGRSERIHIVGIGTSWHAALVAEGFFRALDPATPVSCHPSFGFVAQPPPLGRGSAVVVISHRASKTYSAEAARMARRTGAYVLGIAGRGARLEGADATLHTCDQELSGAFTKSYTSALGLLALLAYEWGRLRRLPEADGFRTSLFALPGLLKKALDCEEEVSRLAQSLAYSEKSFFISWGPNLPTALEAALKMKETNYMPSEGVELENFLHGPIAAADTKTLACLILPPAREGGRVGELLKALRVIGAHPLAVVEEGEPALGADLVRVPRTQPALSPVLSVVPLQFLCYFLATRRGTHPDLLRREQPAHRRARERYRL